MREVSSMNSYSCGLEYSNRCCRCAFCWFLKSFSLTAFLNGVGWGLVVVYWIVLPKMDGAKWVYVKDSGVVKKNVAAEKTNENTLAKPNAQVQRGL